ncbi:ABC transporter ATP-binding protein [Enterococcus faecalis]|nr:ABC transporter ATP-binding protein [Enterococcus faecalis]
MITMKNVTIKYNDTVVIKGISHSFSSNGLSIITGDSGAGKTTLLKTIGGYLSNYKGKVLYKGKNWVDYSKDERSFEHFFNIGYLPQDYGLIEGLSVLENIMIQKSKHSAPIDKDIDHLLKEFGLEDVKGEKIEQLSGGQKQRTALLRVIVQDPEVILADEPTSSLDQENKQIVIDKLKELSKTKKIIMITHDKSLVSQANELLFLTNGKFKILQPDSKPSNYPIDASKDAEGLPRIKLHLHASNFLKKNKYLCLLLSFIIIVSSIAIPSVGFVSKKFEYNINKYVRDNPQLKMLYLNGSSEKLKKVYNKINNNKEISYIDRGIFSKNILLTDQNNNRIEIKNKLPTNFVTTNFVFGRLPKRNSNEIALSTSIAKKLSTKLSDLIGKKITLEYGNRKYQASISGIMDSRFDDIEANPLLNNSKLTVDNTTALMIYVKNIQHLNQISNHIKQIDKGITISSKEEQVKTFLESEKKIQKNLTLLSLVLSITSILGTIFLSVYYIKKSKQNFENYQRLGFSSANLRTLFFLQNFYVFILSIILSVPVVGIESLVINNKFLEFVGFEFTLLLILTIILPQVIYSLIIYLYQHNRNTLRV